MELCQYGTLYDVMNQARRIVHINQDIQSGRLPLNYLQNSELKVCRPEQDGKYMYGLRCVIHSGASMVWSIGVP